MNLELQWIFSIRDMKTYKLLFIFLGQWLKIVYKSPKKRKGDPKLDSKNTSMYTNDCGILEPEKIYALIFN